MTRRTLTDAERIASIREVIEAARGDWHEATALLSVGADLHWLLKRAALPNREDAPEPSAGDRNAVLDEVMTVVGETPTFGDDRMLVYRSELLNRLLLLRVVVREDAPSREGLDRLRKEIHPFADDRTVQYRSGWNDALAAAALAATPPGDPTDG